MNEVYWIKAKERRDDLRTKKHCINGANHAPPEPGRDKCAWCIQVHRRGVLAVLRDPDAPPRPAGYKFQLRRNMRGLVKEIY